MAFVKSTRRFKPKFLQVYEVQEDLKMNHAMHFVLTLITFGLWGLVWWYLILKSQGDNQSLFSGFDDDYWSYLIECEQPPASLYRQRFAASVNSVQFEA
ncbi:DUF4234 domain-containing protein [Shewanella sp. FJAT-51649]|uniref:DUF4234 domain-containing protein n=1 Tax=Shewanella TaxID=22 RepID=UPI001C65F7F0|nr:DUF4234 domain-containing protein [Shewanella sp. FJAT-51649]QYJ70706.1 DUF4234 domain-containing protein [Shewanella sp. FJAT-51649]